MKRNIQEYLKFYAEQYCPLDDEDDNFDVFDRTGSNVDDAYNMGISTGQTLMARNLLDKYFNDSEVG